MNILHRRRRQEQYCTAFLGGFAAMPLTSGIIKRLIRFIRNKFKYIIRAPWGTHSCPTLVGYIIPQVYHAVGISSPTDVGDIIRTNGAINGNLKI